MSEPAAPSTHTYFGRHIRHSTSQISVEQISNISRDEMNQARRDQSELMRFLQGDLLPYVQFARHQYLSLREAIADRLEEWPPVTLSESYALKCSVVTLTSAIVMHKDQTRMRMMRAHKGVSSEAESHAASLDQQFYDSSFSYRFVARLRNLLLHKSPEVVEVHASRGGVQPSGLIVPTSSVRVSASRSDLLQEDVWSAVRTEIEALEDENIDLTPHLLEACTVAEQFAARARVLLFPGITMCIRRMETWRERFADSAGYPVMVHIPDVERFVAPAESNIEVQNLQFDLIDEARGLIAEARRRPK